MFLPQELTSCQETDGLKLIVSFVVVMLRGSETVHVDRCESEWTFASNERTVQIVIKINLINYFVLLYLARCSRILRAGIDMQCLYLHNQGFAGGEP